MDKTQKQLRQEAIARILDCSSIDSQEELLQRLGEEGFELTQATLSRDFREMKIAKTPDNAGNTSIVYRAYNYHKQKWLNRESCPHSCVMDCSALTSPVRWR